jgi:phosphomannomutase
VRTVDVLPAYRERIVGDCKLARPMKVVLDCGNGVAGQGCYDPSHG